MIKRNIICLLCFVLLFSCKDENTTMDIQSKYILSGIGSEKINIHSFPSELKISFKNVTVGDEPTISYSGDLFIDLDSDNNNDVKLHAYYGHGCSMMGSA